MYLTQAKLTAAGAKKLGHMRSTGRYAMHQLLWEIFEKDPEAERDFLFQIGKDHVFILSARKPVDNPYFDVLTKSFDIPFARGQRVQFKTEVNPVKRIQDGGKTKKVDIVQHSRFMARERGQEPNDRLTIAQEEGLTWFKRQGNLRGFEIESFEVESYQTERFKKRSSSYPIRIATMKAQGLMKITDPDLFKKSLLEGIGPSRAFGCGMLLIKPA